MANVAPRRSRGSRLLPAAFILALAWISLPDKAKIAVRQAIASRLVQAAALIGGPEFAVSSSSASSSQRQSGTGRPVVRSLPGSRSSPTRDSPPARAPLIPARDFNEDIEEEDYYDGGAVDISAVSSHSSSSDADAVKVSRKLSDVAGADTTAPLLSSSMHRPHRHTAAQERAFELLKSLEPLDVWEFQQEKSDVRISIKAVEGVSLPMVRGDGVILGPWTLQEVYSVIRSSNCRKTWDPRFESGEALEYFNTDEALGYSCQKGTFPVSGRDFVTVVFRRTTETNKKLYYVSSSVNDPTAPSEGRGKVRAELSVAGWVLQAREGGDGIDVSYIVQVDPKGSIPSALVKIVQVQTPLCIAEVARYLSRSGPIPFIIRDHPDFGPTGDVEIMSEENDDRTSCYDLDLTVRAMPLSALDGRRGLISIALPRGCYANGADATVALTPATTGGEVRARVVMGDGVDGWTLTAPVVPEKLRGVVSGEATISVLQIWIAGELEKDVEMEIKIVPGRNGVVVNSAPVDAK